MSEHHLRLHINALWTIVIVVALFVGSLSLSKSKGERYTFGDARLEHILLKNHCLTYSESQVELLIAMHGSRGHDGVVIKTPFNQWLKTLASEPCEELDKELKVMEK